MPLSLKSNLLLLSLLSLIITSCDSNSFSSTTSVRDLKDFEPVVNFGKVGEKFFKVDSLSDWYFVIPQAIVLDGIEFIVTLDVGSNSILLYDYDSGEISQKLSFPSEGPRGVSSIVAFQAISSDSLMVIDNKKSLTIWDFYGKMKSRYSLRGISAVPTLKANALPGIIEDNKLILENYPIINFDQKMKFVLDFEDSSLSQLELIPKEVIEGFYGLGDFMNFSVVINEPEKRMIYNFPNLDSLYIWSYNMKELVKRYAGSRQFDHPIAPIADINLPVPDQKELEKRPFRKPIYSRLFFDENRNFYYRLIGHPISESLLDSGDPVKSRVREYSILVLNSDFEWMGEFKLPSYEYTIDIDLIFINQYGLHFQKKSLDEDIAMFDVYKIIDK